MRTGRAVMLLAGLAAACGKHHPPPIGSSPGGDTAGDGPDSGGLYIPPPTPPGPDAGLCGNLKIPVVVERPNFYFILDASGSMSNWMPDDEVLGADSGPLRTTTKIPTRYGAAWLALRELLRAVGHRISYGAALFPDTDSDGGYSPGCVPGREVFPTQPGDAVSYAISHKDGRVESTLLGILDSRAPSGATPTAASIGALKRTLVTLPGKTYAFLLTDGAPNCNANAACTAAGCTVNIEQLCPLGGGENCCDPKFGLSDYRSCLDADPTVQAVADLASAGVQTFVIGMPGSDAYASVLTRIAEAGQTGHQYYPVTGTANLARTLREVGLPVAISCDVPLGAVPPDPQLVNVFFDRTVVPEDATDGWTWVGADQIRLVGTECDILKSGSVGQVQVVAGCPTATR